MIWKTHPLLPTFSFLFHGNGTCTYSIRNSEMWSTQTFLMMDVIYKIIRLNRAFWITSASVFYSFICLQLSGHNVCMRCFGRTRIQIIEILATQRSSVKITVGLCSCRHAVTRLLIRAAWSPLLALCRLHDKTKWLWHNINKVIFIFVWFIL